MVRRQIDAFLRRVRQVLDSDAKWIVFIKEMLSTLGIVAVVGLVLFGVSGLWPPLVAVASGSMTPHMQTNDLVFVTEEHRFSGDAAHGQTGVVTYSSGQQTGYSSFDEPGNVIVYEKYGKENAVPIIHRARFWVNNSENWYQKANQSYLGTAQNCEELTYCPAPHAGFITKGDANANYDQVGWVEDDIISSPIKPEWIIGTARFQVPWLGKVRLIFGEAAATATTNSTVGM